MSTQRKDLDMRLLLLSNSTCYQRGYLEHALGDLKDFLGDSVRKVLFIPYAGVTIAWDTYTAKVREKFDEIGYGLESVHEKSDPEAAVLDAEAVAVGGGNTFCLLRELYETRLIEPIRERVLAGMPYMGWSAGSNVASPTIRTTNDMPIVEPPSFKALDLISFQINPHYTDAVLPQHQGETRADRIAEFIEANPYATVVGLREGSILRVEGRSLELLGDKDMRLFRQGQDAREYATTDSIDFLLG
jgi:dipeptidase E